MKISAITLYNNSFSAKKINKRNDNNSISDFKKSSNVVFQSKSENVSASRNSNYDVKLIVLDSKMNYLEAVKLLNKSADIKKSGDDLKMQSDIIRKNAIDIINCHIRNGSDKIVNKNGYSYLDDSYDADKSFRRCYFTQDKDGQIDVFNIREGVKLSNSQNITFDREFIYNDNSISEIRIKPSKKQNTFTCNRSYKYAQDGRLIRVIDNPVYNRNALIQSFKTDYSYDKNGISTVRKGYKQIKEKFSYDKILYYNNNSINSIVIQNGNTEKTYNYNQDGTLHHFIRHKKLNSNSDNLYHQDKFIVFDKNNTKRKK